MIKKIDWRMGFSGILAIFYFLIKKNLNTINNLFYKRQEPYKGLTLIEKCG